jgi:hypothetical protein
MPACLLCCLHVHLSACLPGLSPQQEYLHQARTPTTGAGSRSAFHFKFFLIPQADPAAYPDSDDDSPSTSIADGPQFDLVQLVLVPPPSPRVLHPPSSSSGSSSSSSSQPLSPGAKQGLLKLLGMCGFADVVSEEEGGEAQAQEATARLTTFLPEAAEVRCAYVGSPWADTTDLPHQACAALKSQHSCSTCVGDSASLRAWLTNISN